MSRRDPEESRIQGLYRRYRQDQSMRRRWDPSRFGNQCIAEERRVGLKNLIDVAGTRRLPDARILDVGCGSGGTLADWLALGARAENLCGVDLLPEPLTEVRAKLVGVAACRADARALPFPDESFDLISAFTLFSSILDDEIATEVAVELMRVLGRDGCLLWYDMRYLSPGNRNVRPITRRRITTLFPGMEIDLRSTTLLPPLARQLHSGMGNLYRWLCRLSVLKSHYLGLIRPPGRSNGRLPC